MALTPEQIKNIKEQLKSQAANLPEDKKALALAEIDSLSPQAIESLLKQQSLSSKSEKEQKTIFRMLVDKDIPSTQVDENKFAIAILDINPISKGHIMIIPKKPVHDSKAIPNQAFSLAKKIAKKISLKLSAKSTEMQTELKFNEVIINIIPCYNELLNINSPRSKSSTEQLEKIASLLRPKQKSNIEKIKIKKVKNSENQILKLPKRIP